MVEGKFQLTSWEVKKYGKIVFLFTFVFLLTKTAHFLGLTPAIRTFGCTLSVYFMFFIFSKLMKLLITQHMFIMYRVAFLTSISSAHGRVDDDIVEAFFVFLPK